MRPLRVWATNVRTYTDLDVTIPTGVAALLGPNGAGKSTIVNAIELALFADGGRDLAPLCSTGADECGIALEFEHGGRLYRVRRTYTSRGGGKATLDLERWEDE